MATTQDFETLVKLLTSLSGDSSLQRIKDTLDENARLTKLISDLEITDNQCHRKIARLQDDLDKEREKSVEKDTALEKIRDSQAGMESALAAAQVKLKAADKIASELQSSIKTKDKQIEDLKSLLTKETLRVSSGEEAQKNTQKQLEVAKKKLAAAEKTLKEKEGELARVEQFSCRLDPLPRETISRELATVFASAREIAKEFFAVDFEESLLSESNSWSALQTHSRVNNSIPVHRTNTTAAKQMRAAAFITVVSFALAQYVFQPTYLLQHDSRLSKIMRELSHREPATEVYLRSVLLATVPGWQKQIGEDMATQAMAEVLAHVELLVPSATRDKFKAKLHDLCQQALRVWTQFQRFESRVDPVMDFHIFDIEWRQLFIPIPSTPAAKPNGAKTSSKDSAAPTPSTPAPADPSSVLDVRDMAAAVWPAFITTGPGGDVEVVAEGFGLSTSQRKAANDERSRRTARQMSRSGARPSSVVNGLNGDGTPTKETQKPFLGGTSTGRRSG